MERTELEKYIIETYPAEMDHPWMKYPGNEVFRHSANGKWFALVMDVDKRKLGLAEEGTLPVVNVKCDPILIGSLLTQAGFFPAYHMNKDHWITIALDGSAEEEKIKLLLDRSFHLTGVKTGRRKTPPDEEKWA